MVVLKETKDAHILPACIVSENSTRIIGKSPRELFDLNSFTEVFSRDQAYELLGYIGLIRNRDADTGVDEPEVFPISLELGHGCLKKLWCAVHKNRANPGLLICDFESDDDQLYSLLPRDRGPCALEDTINSNPVRKKVLGRAETHSPTLKVLRSTRTPKRETNAMEVLHILSQIEEQFAETSDLQNLLSVLISVVKDLTGFPQIMINRFGQHLNGGVIAELIDYGMTKDLSKGPEFGLSDISTEAKELYTLSRGCLPYDHDQPTSQLVGRTVKELECSLDLTYSYLRAIPSSHLRHLLPVAVRTSVSMAISTFGKPWAMVVYHSYNLHRTQLSFPTRQLYRLVSGSASRNIERLSNASRLRAWKLMNTVPPENNLWEHIIAATDDLLEFFDADFGIISIKNGARVLGHSEQPQDVLTILEHLKTRKIGSVTASTNISQDFPDLRFSPDSKDISGMLIIPIPIGSSDYIIFFRYCQIRETIGADNPHNYDFKSWSEMAAKESTKWSKEHIEAATVLCILYRKFAQIWTQKEAALHSSKLTRLLLVNTAREIRAPLNRIFSYLEIALGNEIDERTREILTKSYAASNSLITQINRLIV
jgi:light-regulated signal transduction histidine kinase (bacteriophytochrome)